MKKRHSICLTAVFLFQISFFNCSYTQDTLPGKDIVPQNGLKLIKPCLDNQDNADLYLNTIFTIDKNLKHNAGLKDSLTHILHFLRSLKRSKEKRVCMLPILTLVDSLSEEKANRRCRVGPEGGGYFFGYCNDVDIKFALLFYLHYKLSRWNYLPERAYFIDIKIKKGEGDEVLSSGAEYDRLVDLYSERINQLSADDLGKSELSLLAGTQYQWEVIIRAEL